MKIPLWVSWLWLIICGLWLGYNLIFFTNVMISISAFMNLMVAGVILFSSIMEVPSCSDTPTEEIET